MPDDLNEMIRVAEARQERAAAAFQKYDTDASGEIDQTEVLCLLKDLGMLDDLKSAPADFLASGFAKYDVDDSGTLSFEEFREFYNAAVDNSKGHVTGLEGHAPTDNQKKKAALAEAKVSQKSGKLKQSKSGKLPQSPSGSLKQFETAAASAVEVDEMSRLLNSKLKPAEQREWFKIFGESARDLDPPIPLPRAPYSRRRFYVRPRGTVDKDGSGRIVFREFKNYVRASAPNGLGLSKKACSDDKLQVPPLPPPPPASALTAPPPLPMHRALAGRRCGLHLMSRTTGALSPRNSDRS